MDSTHPELVSTPGHAGAAGRPEWGRRRWLVLTSLLFIFQAALIFSLSDRRTISLPAHPREQNFLLMPDSGADLALRELWALQDPTVFGLANPHGFSGQAWLRPVEHLVPKSVSAPGISWLGRSDLAGAGPALVSQANPAAFEEKILEKPTAPLALLAPPPEEEGKSTFQITGGLAARPLLSAMILPPQYHTDILTNSVVEIGVNSAGYVLSTRLVTSCGLKKADLDAVALARQARFGRTAGGTPRWLEDSRAGESAAAERLAEDARLTWGKLTISWFALQLPNPAANRISPP